MAEQFHKGVNETADPSALMPGEMNPASGLYYRPNDDRAWLVRGHSVLGTLGGNSQGLQFVPFDNGPDSIVARAGDALYAADAANPMFSTANVTPATTGLLGDRMIDVHFNDRRYLALGPNQQGKVLRSTGALPLKVRDWGLVAPATEPTLLAKSTAGATVRPSVVSLNQGWGNVAAAYDGDLQTYAHATLSGPPGETRTLVLRGFGADTGVGRRLILDYEILSVKNQPTNPGTGTTVDGAVDDNATVGTLGANVTLIWQRRDSTSSDLIECGRTTFSTSNPRGTAQVTWDADGADTASFAEVTLIFRYAKGSAQVQIRVFDVRIQRDGTVAPFSGTFLYYTSEYIGDDADPPENLYGPRSKPASVTTAAGSSHSAVLVTRPAQANPAATHWHVYRTVAGGTLNTAGLISRVPIAETTFLDDFTTFPPTVQPSEAFPLFAVGSLYFERDTPPPALAYAWVHQGQMLGIDARDQRSLRASIQGFTESWPAIYALPAIPLPEHDKLLYGVELIGFSVIGSTGGMLRVDGVPRIDNGIFQQGEAVRISGAPGGTGYKAFTKLPWKGTPGVAWISPDLGICVTNGHTWDFVANDIDWNKFRDLDMSNFVLAWDSGRRVLIFACSLTGGENDTYYLGHVERGKPSGGIVWTGPTPGSGFDHLTAGNVAGGGHRLYGAGGPTVFRLDDPASTEPVPFLLGSRRVYSPNWGATSVLDGRLRHTDWGAGAVATLAWRAGRDGGTEPFVHTKTVQVPLAGARGSQFDISRSGEWHEYTISGIGDAGDRALIDMEIDGLALGREGKMAGAA